MNIPTPNAKMTSCSVCAAPYHTICAGKQVRLSNGGYTKCCGSSSTSARTSTNPNGGEAITRDVFNATLDDQLKALFTKIMNELPNVIATSVISLQQQIDNHEARIAAIESSYSSTPNTMDSEEVYREASERIRRAKNAIVFGLEEQGNAASDLTTINTLFASIPIQLAARSAFRLGKERANAHRPLKLVFASEVDVHALFRNARLLRSHNLTVRSDQTPNQRKYLDSLRAQRDDRAKKGETNLTIKYIHGAPTIVTKENAIARDVQSN